MESNTEKSDVPAEREPAVEIAPVVRRQSKVGIFVVAGVCVLTLVMLLGLGDSIRRRTDGRKPIQAETKRRPPVQITEPVSRPTPPREADPAEILD